MKILELLSDESKWIKYCMARDTNGERCKVERGASFCLNGAVSRCYTNWEEKRSVRQKLSAAVDVLFPECPGVLTDFNDARETTFADVRRVIELANV